MTYYQETLVVFAIVVVMLGFCAWLLFRAQNNVVELPPPEIKPVPVAPPVAEPARGKPAMVRIQLTSAKGRELGPPISIEARQRRPVLRHKTRDGLLSVFVAGKQRADGVWEYRRVGVEREG